MDNKVKFSTFIIREKTEEGYHISLIWPNGWIEPWDGLTLNLLQQYVSLLNEVKVQSLCVYLQSSESVIFNLVHYPIKRGAFEIVVDEDSDRIYVIGDLLSPAPDVKKTLNSEYRCWLAHTLDRQYSIPKAISLESLIRRPLIGYDHD